MRIKTIFIIAVTILITIVLMQNNQTAKFDILFSEIHVSNSVVMAAFAIIGFIIGLLAGRPHKATFDNNHPSLDNPTGTKLNTLSDEDRDYIS